MGKNTAIEWADHTFNPWMGCTKIGPGCDNCYAEGIGKRTGMVQWGNEAPRVRTSETYWKQPLLWNKRCEQQGVRSRVFCASMADLFDNQAPQAWRDDLWALIEKTPYLDWQLLTKRVGNASTMVPRHWMDGEWPSHVWLGATVCNQEETDRDVPKLLEDVPAAKRFLSIEPMLGPIKLNPHYLASERCIDTFIDWVIVGGESSPKARGMHPNWVRSVRDQCTEARTPFFFKQWGEWQPLSTIDGRQETPFGFYRPPSIDDPIGFMFSRVGKKKSGRVLDGRTWDEVPV